MTSMKNIKIALLSIFSLALVSVGFVAMNPSPSVANAASCGRGNILGFRPWYDGLVDGNCNIRSPQADTDGDGLRRFVWRIIINIADTILKLAAYVSVGVIIYGGFVYLTSAGIPDKAIKGRKTIIGAVVGLVVALSAVGLVNLVGGGLGL